MIRHTFRSLLRTPAFTLVALFCLALGIGATTCIFSIVNAVLFRPLPFAQPERLVRIYTEFPHYQGGGLHKFWVSEPEVFKLKQAHSFSALGAWQTGGVNLSKGGDPARATAAFVSAALLRGLGIHPLLGRLDVLVDDATVAIENISHHLESGKPLHEAILVGAGEIATPTFVSTMSICIVFVPMFLLSGVARYLFVPLAEAVVFAMCASYFFSRTLRALIAGLGRQSFAWEILVVNDASRDNTEEVLL